jgi:NAD+ diphosphatase
MLGFRAQAKSEEIKIDPDELAEARWFTAEELHTAGEWGDNSTGLKISRKDSIARYLIDSWINEQG